MIKTKFQTQKHGLCLALKGFENIAGKGENAGHHYFLLFPQCLLPY